jgi:magnesium transporter
MRTDFVQLHAEQTVAQALESILQQQPAGRIIYFYVADSDGRLLGVVPTRRLLLSPREKLLSEVMVSPVIAIPRDATVLDACEFFILHKLLAFPVVDELRRIVGLVDVELYTEERSEMDQRESHNDLFQLIGLQVTEAQPNSVPVVFRRRFPWLIVSLMGGLSAALITDLYYSVASLALIIPFIPLVLAMASSVTSQSVSLALQTLHGRAPAWPTLLAKIKFEFAIGSLLGVTCGLMAGLVAFAWKGNLTAALTLLGGIAGSVICSAVLGFAMPYLFRAFQQNPNVAAGPIALASADLVTLLVYFNLARWLFA